MLGRLISYYIFLLLISCGTPGQPSDPMPGYDLNKPVQVKLPLPLDEISGLAYYAPDTCLFSITDEEGLLYKIQASGQISTWPFSHKGDYEDIVLVDSVFYIMESNGRITEVHFDGGQANSTPYEFPFGKKNEFESIYQDPGTDDLVLICKDCESDKKKALTTFRFNIRTRQFSDESFLINVKNIDQILGIKKMSFKPSAAAVNPVDHNIYIISSINKLIVVVDKQGEVRGAYRINRKLFKQPEGLAFKKDGTMIVSNEFGGTGTADLLIFKYNQKRI